MAQSLICPARLTAVLVVAFRGRYVAVGTVAKSCCIGHMTIAGSACSLIWISLDGGSTWGRVADRLGFEGTNNEIPAVTPMPTGLLAVGRRWDSGSTHPLPEAWLAEP